MLNREETIKQIKECMNELDASAVCALFLISVEKEEGQGEEKDLSCSQMIDSAASVLSRFFWIRDILGYLGENRFAAFLTGHLTEKMIWDKAETLNQALELAAEGNQRGRISSFIGVYLFQAGGESFSNVLRKAEYALSLAPKEGQENIYLCTALGEERNVPLPPSLHSSPLLLNYVDEGVRLLEVGQEIKTIYVSPGFFCRLNLEVEKGENHVQIHPGDRKLYEESLRKAASQKNPVECTYRFLRDGGKWISCSIQLLQVASLEGSHIVLEISHNTAGLEQLKSQLDEKREWLRFAAHQTEYQLWEADLKTKTFRMLYTKNLKKGRQTVYENFPESLVAGGRIHINSAERFRRFVEGMYSGKTDASENFMVQHRQSSCYGWAALTYHILYDEDGHPDKAIGITEDLSYFPHQQSRVIQRRVMPPELYPHLYCFVQADLTADRVEKFQMEGREQLNPIRQQTYDEAINHRLVSLFSAEDRIRLQQKFKRENLLQAFRHGRCWFYETCRLIGENGVIRWISAGVNLSSDPETKDVCLFAYLSGREDRHQWENALASSGETDPVTGIYLQKTAEALIRYLLSRKTQGPCALAEIFLEGGEELFDEEEKGKKADIFTALHVFLDTDCVVGQKSDNSIFVFFPDPHSKDQLRYRLENAFYYARVSLSGMKELRFLRFAAGVAWSRRDRASYEELVSAASRLCRMHTGEGEDSVSFSSSHCLTGMELNDPSPENLQETAVDNKGEMTGEEKDIALECMGEMLKSDNGESIIYDVLKKLGRYYLADRMYILILAEEGRTLVMLKEWLGNGKCSIQQSITGKPTKRFPVISRCARSESPIMLSLNREIDSGRGWGIPWRYAVFPMGKVNDSKWLLCVENPRRSIDHTALFDTLIPCLRRVNGAPVPIPEKTPLERYFSLPNLKACLNEIYSLNSDSLSSLGVFAVDIPDFAEIKDQMGYEYGQNFLLRISEVLISVFGSRLLFHTQEAEFIVLCPDITYEAFLNRCTKVRLQIGRRYSGQFRDGCSWADQNFAGQDLMNKARSIMRCSGYYEPGVLDFRTSGSQREKPQQTMEEAGKRETATIYLQPKVDMRTGRLVGAEALARVLDEQGNLMPHMRVIESMEKEGTIQKLDYFVLDKTLETLSRWQEKGYELVNISSNFSRNTLVNPSSLASVLAILSHYPHIPQSLIELEITETAGNFENNTFSELIQRFGNYGLQFSLDDFGSSYSNMSMLANLRFHSVKLDRSMISNIAVNPVSRMIVKDIAKICASCGMLCIAEGVETEAQVKALLDNGCFYAQGYYYGRPMTVQKFEETYFQKERAGGK